MSGSFGDAPHLADCDLTADDVMALLSEASNKRRLKLELAHALMAMTANFDAKGKRQLIPQEVKLIVWQRDGEYELRNGRTVHVIWLSINQTRCNIVAWGVGANPAPMKTVDNVNRLQASGLSDQLLDEFENLP